MNIDASWNIDLSQHEDRPLSVAKVVKTFGSIFCGLTKLSTSFATVSVQPFRYFITRALLAGLLMSAASGCGSSLPDLSSVKKQMSAEQLEVAEPVANSVGISLIPIPAGEFLMGTAESKVVDGKKKTKKKEAPPGSEGEHPQHKVLITKPFFIGMCEVTQTQYEKVMGETPWKGQPLTTEGENVAASYISWDNAVEFCGKLSKLENAVYRLPTEAEWEYACRSGTATTYTFGDDVFLLDQHAWFDQNAYQQSEQYAHAAGQKLPNAWSLYDMHGNVCEWCSDFHGSYADRIKQSENDVVTDPQGPGKGRQHAWRGGGFADNAVNLRSASRNSYGRVGYRPEFVAGFRVIKEMDFTP